MSIFARPHYMSDATLFINKLKQEHPELEMQQRAGRARLWDKPVDRSLWADFNAGEVEQKPYVYQTEPLKGI